MEAKEVTTQCRALRLVPYAIVLAIAAVVSLPATPANADVWNPGEPIGTLNGAERWCGVPDPDPNLCSGKQFNLDVTNLTPWADTSPGGGGAIGAGLAQFSHDGAYDGGYDDLDVTIWCVPTPVILFNWIFWVPPILDLKEVGEGNPAPPGAEGARISFSCNVLYVDAPNNKYGDWNFRLWQDRAKWYVNELPGIGPGTDRGWAYISYPGGRTIKQINVPVSEHQYSRGIRFCTPNSNPDDCTPAAAGSSLRTPSDPAVAFESLRTYRTEDVLDSLQSMLPPGAPESLRAALARRTLEAMSTGK